MPRMTKDDAVQVLSNLRRYTPERSVVVSTDFHTLSWDQLDAVLEAADKYHYRKPTNANGSRARYFFAYLCRAAARG